MGNIRIGSGSHTLILDDTLHRMVEQCLEQASPVSMGALREEMGAIVDQAENEWPVKTGRSARALGWAVRLPDPTTVEGFIYNDALDDNGEPYAFYIKGKAQGGKSTWQELVVKRWRERTPYFVDRVAREVVATMATNRLR